MDPAFPLKFRQLQYFLAVAELNHFTQAADYLNVTQPTLSHQIADLERQLGVQLFDRMGKSVRPTEAGDLFRGFVEASLRQIASGRAALAELQGLERGTLRIGVSQSFVRRLLPPLIGRFAKQHPGVAMNIQEMGASSIEAGLIAGTLDLGLAYAPAIMPEIEIEALFEERLLLVVGHDHRFAKRGEIRMAELDGILLALLPSDYTTRKMLDTMLRNAGARPRVVAESNSVTMLVGMAESTEIGTIVLESALGRHEDFAVVGLTDPSPARTSALLWPRQMYRSIAARRFATMVHESFDRPATTRSR